MTRFPGAPTLRWVEASLGRGSRVVGGRRLRGGITSAVHRLAVERRTGATAARVQVVLRRWVDDRWGAAEAAVEREADVLTKLRGTGVPAPELIASSRGEATEGVPALLMSRVPGHVHLAPSDPSSWLAQMAAMLASIHDLDVALPHDPAAAREPRAVPAWTAHPANFEAALRVVGAPPPAYEPRFAHRDYQHFNLLWRRERLTGVVDWTYSATGAADLDVAHCRRNLAILFSAGWADEFLRRYEAETGRTVHPWFDLSLLTQFGEEWQQFIPLQVAGRIPVDTAGMPARVDELIASVLRRM